MEKITILDNSAMLLLKGGEEIEFAVEEVNRPSGGGNGDDTPTGDKAGTGRTNLSDRV